MNIVGIGPGDEEYLTREACRALKESDVIIGYKTYINLLKNFQTKRKIISSGMTKEIERARLAIKLAKEGKVVSLVSGGDSGIYGMSGLTLELLNNEEYNIKVKIISGLTALTAASSLLGAPLTDDFAVISLSNLLTDIRQIIKRVELAVKGDFVIIFYNPQSNTRKEPLKKAYKILEKYLKAKTPIGIVRNARRTGQEIIISTLEDMPFEKIDMSTIVIIGNSKTYAKNGFMITPRGYKIYRRADNV